MRSNVCHFFLAWMFASAALAAEVTGPRIDLRVEQPAYAALPIWLDVTVHDACMNKDYPGTSGLQGQFGSALGYDPWAGRAEVKGPDGDIEAAGFAVPGLPAHWMMSKHSPCTAAFSGAAASMHRFPLHIAADLHQPGQYQVRWVIGRPDVLVRSAWVSFSVARSTPAQIETWLTDLLAHVPTDADMIRKTYIPALLVQPDDPRVVRRLLDFTCSPDQRIGDAAFERLPAPTWPGCGRVSGSSCR